VKHHETAWGHTEQKAWNADIRCSASPWQCMSAYSFSHSSTAGAFQLGVVWSPSSQPWSRTCLPTWNTGWDDSPSTMESWWKVSKRGWAHRRQTSLTQAHKNLFHDASGLIPSVIKVRSSLSMYVFFVYIEIFSHCFFC
jgi:hypothetical protein